MDPIVIVAVATALTAGLSGWHVRHHHRQVPEPPRASWLAQATRRRLVVQTSDGHSVDGHLVDVDEHGLTVAPAQVDGEQLAGTVWVPRDRVRWVQDPEV